MGEYTRAEIEEKLTQAAEHVETLYRADCVNYRGPSAKSEERYTEIAASWLLEHQELLDRIQQTTRNSSYQVVGHDDLLQKPESNRGEEHLAYALRDQREIAGLGAVLDFQVPLKNVQSDGAGKIDLVADDGENFFLLELKAENAKDTLLRCVLEIFTYWKIVDQKKLLRDFLGEDAERKVVPAILVYEGSSQHQELMAQQPRIGELMALCGVRAFLLGKTEAEYVCCEYQRT